MKKTVLSTLVLMLIVVSCAKDAVRRSKVYRSGDIAIRFNDFTDSRCPENANCIRAGEATVLLTASKGSESVDFILKGVGADTVLFNHRIEFVNLLPYPVSGVELDPGDKELILEVTKL